MSDRFDRPHSEICNMIDVLSEGIFDKEEEESKRAFIERCIEVALEYGHTVDIPVQHAGGCC